tara:strand:- start:790 stop:1365 length:576 start_codon:yes stop_codon:yes gene_type:complete
MKVLGESEALKVLENGFPLIFQTDTLPAISCRPEYSEVIYKVKKRDKKKPLILMGSNISQLINNVHSVARDDVQEIASKFWPGPLTLIIPAHENCNFKFLSSEKTLGIRVPNSFSAKSLILKTGPLATSSANISGETTSLTENQVSNDLPNVPLLGPIPWHKCSGEASTIISWKKNGEWELIRQGRLTFSR